MRTFVLSAVMVSVICLSLLTGIPSALAEPSQTLEGNTGPRFIAYYFYTSKRCVSCRTIEKYAQEAVTQAFGDQIENGQLAWRALNIEQPENKHFIYDFALYTKSVVVAEYKDGKPVRWENLDQVWKLFRDKDKYIDYVTSRTKAFMEKS